MKIEDEEFENYPISYSIDNAILMHRDAHFGGSFPLMIEYYGGEGKGICKEFDLSRIQELYQQETQTAGNLSAIMLSGAEAEKVAEAKKAYKQLKEIYDIEHPKTIIPRLIADLILAEDEQESEDAVKATVHQGQKIVPYLIELLKDEQYYNPLFPGYGQAPILAAECLGRIGDKKAIIYLFQALESSDFFNEDVILSSLHAIGEPAKEFLLKVLHAEPITMDNEQAAIALIRFKENFEVAKACFERFKTLHAKNQLDKYLALSTYLVLACEGLNDRALQRELLDLSTSPSTPKSIRQDIALLEKHWQ
jgi:hypothetical protein